MDPETIEKMKRALQTLGFVMDELIPVDGSYAGMSWYDLLEELKKNPSLGEVFAVILEASVAKEPEFDPDGDRIARIMGRPDGMVVYQVTLEQFREVFENFLQNHGLQLDDLTDEEIEFFYYSFCHTIDEAAAWYATMLAIFETSNVYRQIIVRCWLTQTLDRIGLLADQRVSEATGELCWREVIDRVSHAAGELAFSIKEANSKTLIHFIAACAVLGEDLAVKLHKQNSQTATWLDTNAARALLALFDRLAAHDAVFKTMLQRLDLSGNADVGVPFEDESESGDETEE